MTPRLLLEIRLLSFVFAVFKNTASCEACEPKCLQKQLFLRFRHVFALIQHLLFTVISITCEVVNSEEKVQLVLRHAYQKNTRRSLQ